MLFRKLTRRMNCRRGCCSCQNCNTCCSRNGCQNSCPQTQTCCCEKKICCTSQIVQPVCTPQPRVERCYEIKRYIDVPMQTWYGPGYSETDCCLQQTEVLREIAETLRAPRQTCLSCVHTCSSCTGCR